MYDMVIDGPDIVSYIRVPLASIIRDHSYSGFANKMKENVLVVKAFDRHRSVDQSACLAEGK